MTPECSRGITHASPMEGDGENAARRGTTAKAAYYCGSSLVFGLRDAADWLNRMVLLSARCCPLFCSDLCRSIARCTAGRSLIRARQSATRGNASREAPNGLAMNAQGKARMSAIE